DDIVGLKRILEDRNKEVARAWVDHALGFEWRLVKEQGGRPRRPHEVQGSGECVGVGIEHWLSVSGLMV
ncbi:MAG: hypothetical protein COA51_09625, partial [Idiomarina sp.]